MKGSSKQKNAERKCSDPARCGSGSTSSKPVPGGRAAVPLAVHAAGSWVPLVTADAVTLVAVEAWGLCSLIYLSNEFAFYKTILFPRWICKKLQCSLRISQQRAAFLAVVRLILGRLFPLPCPSPPPNKQINRQKIYPCLIQATILPSLRGASEDKPWKMFRIFVVWKDCGFVTGSSDRNSWLDRTRTYLSALVDVSSLRSVTGLGSWGQESASWLKVMPNELWRWWAGWSPGDKADQYFQLPKSLLAGIDRQRYRNNGVYENGGTWVKCIVCN